MTNSYLQENSLPFQCDLDITEGKRYLMSHIFPAIGHDQNKKQFLAARVLMANLLQIATTDHMTIGIPRGNGTISTMTPNNPHKITTHLIKNRLQYLENRQIFQIRKGFFNKCKNEGKVTRYTLKDSFKEFIQNIGLTPFDFEKIEMPESLLILKDVINKNSIVYKDNEETIGIKNGLMALNKLIQKSNIKIDGDPLQKDYFYRVFNRGDFRTGGRFYSTKITNLRKNLRKKLPLMVYH